MPRPLRLDFPGAFFHIYTRGNERREIYRDAADRNVFLDVLGRSCERFGIVVHGYCLMDNHYHLVAQSREGRISAGIQHLNGSYARRFNDRHERKGHLFQGRFGANLIDEDSYLLTAVRYVELNPCRARLVGDPATWRWSSHAARIGMAAIPKFLDVESVLRRFGSEDDARGAYREFVLAGLHDREVARRLASATILGPASFVRHHAARARAMKEQLKVPRRQAIADRPTLAALLDPAGNREILRREAAAAVCIHRYTMVEVSRHLGLHYTTISRWVSRHATRNGGGMR